MRGFLSYLTVSGSLKIRYGIWRTPHVDSIGAMVLLNGRTEFLEKYTETISDLLARGLDVFSMDWRGQGFSGRLLSNPCKGHVDSFDSYLKDLDRFIEKIVIPMAKGRLFLMGHSMGGHLALRYLHDRPGRIHKAVLVCPMIGIFDAGPVRVVADLLATTAVKLGLEDCYVPGCGDWSEKDEKFKGNRLTSDPGRFAETVDLIRANPGLALGGATFGWLKAALKSIQTISTPLYAESIASPILMVCGGKDKVVSEKAQTAMAARLPHCKHRIIGESRHELLMEADPLRQEFWKIFDQFVRTRSQGTASAALPGI